MINAKRVARLAHTFSRPGGANDQCNDAFVPIIAFHARRTAARFVAFGSAVSLGEQELPQL